MWHILQTIHAVLRDVQAALHVELLQTRESRQLFEALVGDLVAVQDCKLLQARHAGNVAQALQQESGSVFVGW